MMAFNWAASSGQEAKWRGDFLTPHSRFNSHQPPAKATLKAAEKRGGVCAF